MLHQKAFSEPKKIAIGKFIIKKEREKSDVTA